MDRKIFFDSVRKSFGKLSQSQVDGFNALIDGWEKRGSVEDRWFAYMLATAWHETAATMLPIKEYGSTAYLQGKPYYPYFGRGYVQLTWEDNYRKMGTKLGVNLLGNNKDKALDPAIAEEVMFVGMRDGDFTGKKLADYFSDTKEDPVNARRIINGTDKADLIAGYYTKFLAAIDAAQVTPDPAPPMVVDETIWIRRTEVALSLRQMADAIEGAS